MSTHIIYVCGKNMGRAMGRENVSSGICGQCGASLACASVQSDQGLHCPLTQSLTSTECMNGGKGPDAHCACAFFV